MAVGLQSLRSGDETGPFRVNTMFGDAQIIALIVLAQRGLESLYAMHNARQLLAGGARETARDFFPVVAVTQLAWLAAIFLMVPHDREIIWPLMALYILLQGVRYWVIFLLGRQWTQRIILPRQPATRGLHAYLAHPYVTLVMLETFLLPVVFGAWELAVIMTAVIGAVRYYQISLEERALAVRHASESARSGQPAIPAQPNQ